MKNKYVIITPARNEEVYIEKTIKSVIYQTVKPIKWVIVSNDSIDRTEDIVSGYSSVYDFIHLLILRGNENYNFSSKAHAFNMGYKYLKGIQYEYIANVDADVAFKSHYFECILEKFQYNSNLGIAGGWIHESKNGIHYRERFGNSKHSVPGATQIFRRQCFEMIGSYIPLDMGGEDSTAEVMARMKGWDTESFEDLKVFHHRKTGTVRRNIYFARYRQGIAHYCVGNHPFYELLKAIKRINERPYVIGSFLRVFGYLMALLYRKKSNISADVIQYRKKEQMIRIKSLFWRG